MPVQLKVYMKHSERVLCSLTEESHLAAVLKHLRDGSSTEQICQNLAERQASDNELTPGSQEAWELRGAGPLSSCVDDQPYHAEGVNCSFGNTENILAHQFLYMRTLPSRPTCHRY
jgi:hypothetical protein